MDALWNLFFVGDKFLGIEWHAWKIIGWFGNVAFFSRFLVQWYATEKQKRVVVPLSFWWLSLAGSLLLLAYAVFYRKDSVFIFAYAFTWIPYIRNLIIHRRTTANQVLCPACGLRGPPAANFCSACGASLRQSKPQG
ncbi:MAG: lipid-A-disaccharide synthase N-terminal domain-containing protein [Chloroflexi bacterium]|nr:lipid-A-disaccharide synthase N-terminal domain-containing protein [Chloroflexota bacterium]